MIRYINIALEVFSGLISLLVVLSIIAGNDKKDRLNQKFVCMLICNIFVLFNDSIALIFKGHMDLGSIILVRIGNFCAFVFSYLILATFTDYLISFLQTKKEISRMPAKIMWGLSIIAIILVFVSQWTNIYYIIDEHNVYHRQGLFWLSQSWGIICLLINSIVILKNHKVLSKRETISLMGYILLPVVAMFIQIFVYGVALLYLSTSISCLALYLNMQIDQAQKTKEIELELERHKIEIMINQIKPHFLYNTLSTIRYLCESNPQQAQIAITQLSQFLRLNIEFLSSTDQIPFVQELEHIKNYLNIECLRFKDKLNIQYDIQTTDFTLPPLTVQPIVENAVHHGVLKNKDGGTIWIQSQETDNDYRILIKDNGVGFHYQEIDSQNETHIGICNVSERLKLVRHGTVEIESSDGEGTTVTLILPKEEK